MSKGNKNYVNSMSLFNVKLIVNLSKHVVAYSTTLPLLPPHYTSASLLDPSISIIDANKQEFLLFLKAVKTYSKTGKKSF